MKKSKLLGIGALAAASLFVSCSDDWNGGASKGNGHINPMVSVDTQTVTSRSTDDDSRAKASRANEITSADLKLRLTKSDGSASWTWDSVAEFPLDQQFGVGAYTLEAYYGDASVQGFDSPAYYGSQDLTVEDDKTTNVALTASLSNAMVTLKYTEAFQGYMADWNAKVNDIEYTKTETRPVYVTPGDVTLKVSVTKPNGLGAEFTLDKVNAEARHHYTVTVDVNNGGVGDATLVVTFDDNMDTEEVEIDLSDKLLSTPAPIIDVAGFTSMTPIDVVAGSTPDNAMSMSLIAMAGLKAVTLTTTSTSLVRQGWPEEIDLMSADASMQAKLTSLGLKVTGLWKVPGEMAVVEFTDVIKNIKTVAGDNNVSSFAITVKDALMRECEPATLVLNVEDVTLELSHAGQYYEPGENLDVTLGYNGTNLAENVTFEYLNPVVNLWRKIDIVKVGEPVARSMSDYLVTLKTPDFDGDLRLRARSGNAVSNELVIGMAPFEVEIDPVNVYATHAYVKIVGVEDQPAPQTTGMQLQAKAGDGEYKDVTYSEADGYAHVTGLTPGTNYKMKVRINGMGSHATDFTTESASEVPNGDFEQLGTPFVGSDIAQGGTWNTSALDFLSNYQNVANFTIQEASGWATTNAKTMNNWGMGNTWFNVPSVFNTTLSYIGHCNGISGGAGKSDATPDSYTGFSAHSGENAMVVRNVAWDANGSVPSKDTSSKSNATNYYNKKVPDVANRSVGKMFLGSYAWSGSAETYNEGTNFSSRPSSLTGWYTYKSDEDGEDTGVVTVEVLSGNTVIATGKATLGITDQYTQFTVPLTYNLNTPKATSVRIMVASSKYASADMSSETANVKVTTYVSRYESYMHGATLVVDDFKFGY